MLILRVLGMASFLIMLLVGSGSAALAAELGTVEGRVMYRGQPVEGAYVLAFSEPDKIFYKIPDIPPASTDIEGRFKQALPKGKYYIAAFKKAAGPDGVLMPGDLYSFYGGNPVGADPSRPVGLTLNMVMKPEVETDIGTGDGPGGIEGTVTFEGKPMDGVVLYVYLDANQRFRGLGYYMTPPTGVDGAFRMKMSEGTYYIIARKRLGGERAGPLQEGDYFGFLDVNPVVVTKGVMKRVELPVVRKAENTTTEEGRTLLGGTVRYKDGKPAPGVYVFVYEEPEMVNRPAFLSKPAGQDGSFSVELPFGGIYYLLARDTIGGPVEAGQLWGRYDGSADHSIKVETGKSLEGVVISVEKMD